MIKHASCHRSVLLRSLLLPLCSVLWLSLALAGEPQHGLALGTAVQYAPGFAHFAYADPRAV
jgi:ABC-type oligopeptide transport system substrate-binding subunit